jgi:uncharacterized membrane-anchored protein YhcB (DUF1043 family)
VNESNIDWILAIACFLAGIGIGALCYHLMNANVARNQKVRQRLAETELELNQVKDGLNDHFAKVADLAASIQRQSHDLEMHLVQGADKLVDDLKLKRRLHGQQEESEEIDAPEVPRDYADGAGGTLAEDYGIRQRHTAEKQQEGTPQPPRY